MVMKKICLMVAFAMVFGTVGCIPGGNDDVEGQHTVNVFTMRVSPDPRSSIMQEIQEKLGGQIRVSAVPDADYDTQLNLRIAAGNTPDIYGGGSQTTLKAAATLTVDMIKDTMPEIYEDFLLSCAHMEANPERIFDRWRVDGDIRAFHNGGRPTGPYSNVIRTDVLEELNVSTSGFLGVTDVSEEHTASVSVFLVLIDISEVHTLCTFRTSDGCRRF